MDTVLVTGANGHLGYNLTQQLVERGYRVRAGVRDFTSKTKTRDLVTLGAEITHVDITRPETLSAAMKDVQGLFHVAAVYETISRNPGRDVKQPTIVGTINTLQAAHAAGVQKVVLTSSATTVGNDASLAAPLDESRWNKDAIEPYVQAKTSAEQWAWEFATRNHFNLVAILPSAMIGPGFRRHTPTTRIFEELLRNRVPVVLPLGFSFVDVRDVATAHVLAYENPTAAGRYIASARFCELAELFTLVRNVDPTVVIPTRRLPERLLPVVPLLDWIGHRFAGTPRAISCAFVKEYGHHEAHFTSARAERELGWMARDFSVSVRDTLSWIKTELLPAGAACSSPVT